jgi:hypothetical protein
MIGTQIVQRRRGGEEFQVRGGRIEPIGLAGIEGVAAVERYDEERRTRVS